MLRSLSISKARCRINYSTTKQATSSEGIAYSYLSSKYSPNSSGLRRYLRSFHTHGWTRHSSGNDGTTNIHTAFRWTGCFKLAYIALVVTVAYMYSPRISSGMSEDSAPDSKDHGASMGPTWVLSAPDWPYDGSMILAIRDAGWKSLGTMDITQRYCWYRRENYFEVCRCCRQYSVDIVLKGRTMV